MFDFRREIAESILAMREFREDLLQLRKSLSDLSERMSGVEERLDALEKRQDTGESEKMVAFECAVEELKLELNDRDQEALLADLDIGHLPEERRAIIYDRKYVIRKWNLTRDAWIRTLSEKKKFKKSGPTASNTKPYKYHNQMLFLKKVVTPGEAHESVPANDETEANSKENEEKLNQIMEQSGSDSQKERQNLAPPKPKEIKRHLNEVDAKIIEYINDHLKKIKNEFDDPKLSFFKGILPQLASFNDDEILDFQSGVINLLRNIKSRRSGQLNYEWSPYSQSSSTPYYQTQGYFSRSNDPNSTP